MFVSIILWNNSSYDLSNWHFIPYNVIWHWFIFGLCHWGDLDVLFKGGDDGLDSLRAEKKLLLEGKCEGEKQNTMGHVKGKTTVINSHFFWITCFPWGLFHCQAQLWESLWINLLKSLWKNTQYRVPTHSRTNNIITMLVYKLKVHVYFLIIDYLHNHFKYSR